MTETNLSARQEGLPRGAVLSYLAVMDTPTRVRMVAARLLKTLGLISLAGALLTMGVLVWMLWKSIETYYRVMPTSPTLGTWLSMDLAEDRFVTLFVAAMFNIGMGGAMLFCVRPVRHAVMSACNFIKVLVTPITLIFWTGVAVVTAICGVEWCYFAESGVPLAESLIFLATPLAAAMVLLLWDLKHLVTWIHRNPITDKPAVKFLSKRGEA